VVGVGVCTGAGLGAIVVGSLAELFVASRSPPPATVAVLVTVAGASPPRRWRR
jgi:hypothetical protein